MVGPARPQIVLFGSSIVQQSFSNGGDGIHLSAEGSKVVVEEILKVLKEADWEPNLHWKSMPTEFSEDSPEHFQVSEAVGQCSDEFLVTWHSATGSRFSDGIVIRACPEELKGLSVGVH
ncbi:GDSL esterase/lipase WDL1-like protein [Drosera capensis]